MSKWFKTRNEEESFIQAYDRASGDYCQARLRDFFGDTESTENELFANHECYTSVVHAINIHQTLTNA